MNYRYPAGWAPPYQGAPPPMPPHVSVNAQQWQMGSWQFNPAYNIQRYPAPQSQWMAASAWAYYPQQRPQNFNPYKKVIRPPSAEYLAMPIKHNGLDLYDMVPKKNPYGDEEDPNVPKTPWIWNPATLQNDAPSLSAQRAAAAAAAAANERTQIRQASEPVSSEPNSTSAARSRYATDPSPSTGASSSANAPYNNSSPLKPTFNRTVVRTPYHYSNSSSTSVDSLTGRMERMSASEPSALGRHSSMPSIYAENHQQPSSMSGIHQLSDEPVSILSPLIIPMDHLPTPTKRPIARGATYPEISSQTALDTIAESPAPAETTPRRSSRAQNVTPPPTRNPAPPQTVPASVESFKRSKPSRSDSLPASKSKPLIYEISFAPPRSSSYDPPPPSYTAGPMPDFHSYFPGYAQKQQQQQQQQQQQHTPPDPDSYPARQHTSPPHSGTPRRPIEIYAPNPSLPQRSQSFSYTPTSYPQSNDTSPPKTSTQHQSSKPSPPEPVRSPRHTPPTRLREYPITPVSPNTPQTYDENRPAPIKPVTVYHPPGPVTPRAGARRGYWNRRGDHCTKEGYVVFAPHDQTYPDDLAGYPENEYENEIKHRIAFDPKRPELPESLPRHGQPPRRPYSSFIPISGT
ncbi:hypothetical protein H0H87_005529 [Tephrocybe sp. NHM501043]|nr:hypothetical protein H0H87_005529 [Tephrocybe sp. NHM501043]